MILHGAVGGSHSLCDLSGKQLKNEALQCADVHVSELSMRRSLRFCGTWAGWHGGWGWIERKTWNLLWERASATRLLFLLHAGSWTQSQIWLGRKRGTLEVHQVGIAGCPGQKSGNDILIVRVECYWCTMPILTPNSNAHNIRGEFLDCNVSLEPRLRPLELKLLEREEAIAATFPWTWRIWHQRWARMLSWEESYPVPLLNEDGPPSNVTTAVRVNVNLLQLQAEDLGSFDELAIKALPGCTTAAAWLQSISFCFEYTDCALRNINCILRCSTVLSADPPSPNDMWADDHTSLGEGRSAARLSTDSYDFATK